MGWGGGSQLYGERSPYNDEGYQVAQRQGLLHCQVGNGDALHDVRLGGGVISHWVRAGVSGSVASSVRAVVRC